MHIEINIFPDPFPLDTNKWRQAIRLIQSRITDHLLNATVNHKSAAYGEQTFLDDDGMIIATVYIRRQ